MRLLIYVLHGKTIEADPRYWYRGTEEPPISFPKANVNTVQVTETETVM